MGGREEIWGELYKNNEYVGSGPGWIWWASRSWPILTSHVTWQLGLAVRDQKYILFAKHQPANLRCAGLEHNDMQWQWLVTFNYCSKTNWVGLNWSYQNAHWFFLLWTMLCCQTTCPDLEMNSFQYLRFVLGMLDSWGRGRVEGGHKKTT